ncbi:MAG: DUF5678 domain-containing protein [Candidatus Nanohaloarchaea archaeon]|nr:DUF5678 domain-containing protein [Candidatus Nanohaloarchaea archaeon]
MDVTTDALEETRSAQTWLSDHFQELRERYSGNFVAIKDEEVKAAAPTTEELKDELSSNGTDPSTTLIKYIRERGQVVIR